MEKEYLVDSQENRAAHLLGAYDLSFSTRIVSPELASHTDPRLTQTHENIHRSLTFSSTFGFLSFVVAQIARSHPDPIHRYRFREVRDALIMHSLDPQEGCAYFTEFLDSELISDVEQTDVRKAASERERWAMDWIARAVRPLRLGPSLQRGFAYLLSDLSLSSPIVHEIADFPPPDIDYLHKYLARPENNPNLRFLTFARAGFWPLWRRWSLRHTFSQTLDTFCKEQSVSRHALDGYINDLDRYKIARLEYMMDVSFRQWLAERLPDYEIIPLEKRVETAQALLDRWRPRLPAEVQALLPERADFLKSNVFYDVSDAALVNPECLERLYRKVDGLSSIMTEVEGKELCVCLLSPNSYPLVKIHLFSDGKIPEGFLVVTVSQFDPKLPNCFEKTGYAFWGSHSTVIEQLRGWNARRMVLIVQVEDFDNRAERVVGEPLSSFRCSIRVLHDGLVLSGTQRYLEALGSEQYPVRTHVTRSGKDEKIRILAAKTDKYPKLEFLAPITQDTFLQIQSLQFEAWVHPILDLNEYEQDQGELWATANACERITRFGFG